MKKERRPRVLIVDDDLESQELYVEILQWAGFDVATADDGDSALEKAVTSEPEAIVLDILLPKRDGIAVLQELRQVPQTAAVPIIALTGVADAADRARIVGGFTEVLEKPCDPNRLITVLRRALDAGVVAES
jgi:two-component system sensor histidine kinase/response regulator